MDPRRRSGSVRACGGSLERACSRRAIRTRLVCAACGFVFYLDPKVAVGTIIRTADEPASCWCGARSSRDTASGCFPGGYVDRGEALTAAAVREAREECGLDVRLDGLVNIYSYAGRTPVIIVYAATALGGELCGDDECLEVAIVHAG